jgi:hypothetical protein
MSDIASSGDSSSSMTGDSWCAMSGNSAPAGDSGIRGCIEVAAINACGPVIDAACASGWRMVIPATRSESRRSNSTSLL